MATNANPFGSWYQKNKKSLSDKRKERYKSDPEYRAKAIENRKRQIERTPKMRDLKPEMYTVSFSMAAEAMEVSLWKLRNWREQDYIPEPHRHGRELWFTNQQLLLMKDLATFFNTYGPRPPKEVEDEFQELIAFIAVNW